MALFKRRCFDWNKTLKQHWVYYRPYGGRCWFSRKWPPKTQSRRMAIFGLFQKGVIFWGSALLNHFYYLGGRFNRGNTVSLLSWVWARSSRERDLNPLFSVHCYATHWFWHVFDHHLSLINGRIQWPFSPQDQRLWGSRSFSLLLFFIFVQKIQPIHQLSFHTFYLSGDKRECAILY